MFGWFKGFWTANFVQDVPAELSQCEFGCRDAKCRHGSWQNCKNRLLTLEGEAAYARQPAKSGGGPAPAGLSWQAAGKTGRQASRQD